MTDLDLIIINHRGRRFGVRVVHPGDRYGLDDCLVYGEKDWDRADDPLVEFYDLTYADPDGAFGPRGQFVSRYFRSTLLGQDPFSRHDVTSPTGAGICLDGGNAEAWTIDATAMAQVGRLLRKVEVSR